jgi:hypothetical protein
MKKVLTLQGQRSTLKSLWRLNQLDVRLYDSQAWFLRGWGGLWLIMFSIGGYDFGEVSNWRGQHLKKFK